MLGCLDSVTGCSEISDNDYIGTILIVIATMAGTLIGIPILILLAVFHQYFTPKAMIRRKRKRLSELILYAERGDFKHVIEFIHQHHTTNTMRTTDDRILNCITWIKSRIRLRIDINGRDQTGKCALFCAVHGKNYQFISESNLECVDVLLHHGVDVISAFDESDRSLQNQELYGMTYFVCYIFDSKPLKKWYALSIMNRLIAAGYILDHTQEYQLLSFLFRKYYEDLDVELMFLLESTVDFAMFRREIVGHAIRQLLHEYQDNDYDNDDDWSRSRKKCYLTNLLDDICQIDSLQSMSRTFIRRYLLNCNEEINLFIITQNLPLPLLMSKYLLFNENRHL